MGLGKGCHEEQEQLALPVDEVRTRQYPLRYRTWWRVSSRIRATLWDTPGGCGLTLWGLGLTCVSRYAAVAYIGKQFFNGGEPPRRVGVEGVQAREWG